MPRPSVRQPDLVARALGELSGEERARVDRALAADPELRQQFEEIAGHLLQYDQAPPAPPPPPFARIAAALGDADAPHATPDLAVLRLQTARPPLRRGLWVAATAAAAVLVAALIWRPWETRPAGAQGMYIVPGGGMELVRAGRPLPAPAHGRIAIAAGDVLRCTSAAEARLGERVRVVLDGGAQLRIEDAEAVTLERGRGWFEVTPGAFEVRTAHGPVRVLGTAFEVDVRHAALEVAVGHGRVAAGGMEIGTGERLAGGRVSPLTAEAGAWFQRPVLRLERGPTPAAAGAPLTLQLVFHNPGHVPLTLPGPSGARRALWLSLETAAEGRVLREWPVLETDVAAGREVLRPGSALRLGPGARHVVTLKILPPVGSPGAYRCRALYRPAGQPGVLSTPLDVEVR